MRMIRRDSELPIELLKPHPKNPRKDVGDVTELAESIKANGIFQPLTVLSGDCIDGYTVVIGHRRLAAAKLAGLKKVPCNVAEMTEQEQISTMLLENMQRNDLTVYEQAQGFQMMLDLGETEQSIAEKTGFSKKTVKHRLKLLELDPEQIRSKAVNTKLRYQQIAAGVEGVAYNYTLPMLIFASLGGLALLFSLWLKAMDKRNGYGLELPNIKE